MNNINDLIAKAKKLDNPEVKAIAQNAEATLGSLALQKTAAKGAFKIASDVFAKYEKGESDLAAVNAALNLFNQSFALATGLEGNMTEFIVGLVAAIHNDMNSEI